MQNGQKTGIFIDVKLAQWRFPGEMPQPVPQTNEERYCTNMGLFPSAGDFKDGQGVEKDAPRKTGVRRFFELVGRDMSSMFLANLITCLGFVPVICLVYVGFLMSNLPVMLVSAAVGGILAGALWGAIPGILKAFLNINEVLACIMTNWLAANIVTWAFDASNFKNVVENTKSGYIYKTTFNGVANPKLFMDKLFPGSQANGGFLIAIVIAIGVYILINKTTLGYELKACGSNRHAARYAGINDKRNIMLSMAIAGALAAGGAALYWLSGNTEFYWSTYQSLPAEGFNGIPVALLAKEDLGSGLVILIIGFVILFIGGASARWILVTIMVSVLGVAGLLIANSAVSTWTGGETQLIKQYQMSRLLVFVDPDNPEYADDAYNLKQAQIAIDTADVIVFITDVQQGLVDSDANKVTNVFSTLF